MLLKNDYIKVQGYLVTQFDKVVLSMMTEKYYIKIIFKIQMLAGICLNTIHVGASSKMSTTLVTLSDVLIFFVCLPQKSEEFYNLFGYRKSKLTF